MKNRIRPLHKYLLFIHDLLLVGASIIFSLVYFSYQYTSENYSYPNNGLAIATAVMLTVIVGNIRNYLYKYQVVLHFTKHIVAIIRSLSFSLISVALILLFVIDVEQSFARKFVYTSYTTICFFMILSRAAIIPRIYFWLVKTKKVQRNLLVIGAGESGRNNVKEIRNDSRSYYQICGYLDDASEKQGKSYDHIPVLGKIVNIEQIIKKYKINEILISISNITYNQLQDLIDECKKTQLPIHLISELYKILSDKLEPENIFGVPAFRISPLRNRTLYSTVSRIIDVILSGVLIVGLSPIWFLLGVLVKISSSGPVLYQAVVIGKNEKEFTWYKYRTMYVDRDENVHKELMKNLIKNNSPALKLSDDNRITPLGKILRKYSLDEFPQLINVFLGDMSLVGPHPKLPYEYELMENWQKRRFSIKPGITGLWQTLGRNEVKFNEEIVLDLYYLESRSFLMDVEILIDTLIVVLTGRNGK